MYIKQFISLNRAAILLALFSFFKLAALSGQNTALPVGSIPGAVDISPSGASTYSIPIEVVPGIRGLQPNLAIVYNSRGGMGLLGMKWDLGGLSAITRMPQTLYHDNAVTAISLNTKDRFALDGNRLVPVHDYGVSGVSYTTEREGFMEIQSILLPTGVGPKWFKVTTEEGNIMEYGSTDDSRVMLGNNALSWYLNKITDPDGNCMIFRYAQANGEIWITGIDYVQHSFYLTTPQAQVTFEYQAGTHYHSYFVAGYEIKQTRLLKKIYVKTLSSGTYINVRTYEFYYDNDLPPKFTEVKLSAGKGSSFNSTVINWQTPTVAEFSRTDFANAPFSKEANHLTGDFNGDGLCDIVEYRDN